MTSEAKRERYSLCREQFIALVDGEPDLIARMSSLAAILHHAFEDFFWTGFYILDPEKGDQLVIGPYQGTVGCLRIDFGRGVCGTAAATRETQVVPDVHAFPGHIACDARSNSEIVVPCIDAARDLYAVLDVDSTQLGTFDEVDKEELERIVPLIIAR